MDPKPHWTVTIGGAASSAQDANAVVEILVAAFRRHPGWRPIRWRVDADGSTVLLGSVAAGNEDDGWYALWAEGIRQQLNPPPGGAP